MAAVSPIHERVMCGYARRSAVRLSSCFIIFTHKCARGNSHPCFASRSLTAVRSRCCAPSLRGTPCFSVCTSAPFMRVISRTVFLGSNVFHTGRRVFPLSHFTYFRVRLSGLPALARAAGIDANVWFLFTVSLSLSLSLALFLSLSPPAPLSLSLPLFLAFPLSLFSNLLSFSFPSPLLSSIFRECYRGGFLHLIST